MYLMAANIKSNIVPSTRPASLNALGRAKTPTPTIRLNI